MIDPLRASFGAGLLLAAALASSSAHAFLSAEHKLIGDEAFSAALAHAKAAKVMSVEGAPKIRLTRWSRRT